MLKISLKTHLTRLSNTEQRKDGLDDFQDIWNIIHTKALPEEIEKVKYRDIKF